MTRTAEACDEETASSSPYAWRVCRRSISDGFVPATDRKWQPTRATRTFAHGNAGAAGSGELDDLAVRKGALEAFAVPDHSQIDLAQCLPGNKSVGTPTLLLCLEFDVIGLSAVERVADNQAAGYVFGADILAAIIPTDEWISRKGRRRDKGKGGQCEANL